MELKPGLSALITGGASGIGKALCLALADRGVFITVVDYSEEEGKKVTALIEKQLAKFHKNLKFPSATFIRCDVTNTGELSSAFAKHLATYGGLDICINNAGIVTPVPLHKDQTDGSGTWKHAINVNLTAVIQCTLLAIKAMQASKRTGVVINMGSSAGLYPLVGDPVYSAAKGGVALFTRALRPYRHQGIRVNVLCPEFVETEIGSHVEAKFLTLLGGFIPIDLVIKGAIELITDETKGGSCLWITNRRGLEYWPTPEEEAKYRVSFSKLKSQSMLNYPLELKLPQSFEKIVVHSLNHNFRAATRIQRTPLGLPIKQHHVLVKILYAGVNASDVNFSSGRYFSGNSQDLAGNLPFDAGFEAVGIIAAVGDSVGALKIGTAAAVMTFGSYAEFMIVPSKFILPVASPDPEVVAMLTSGLTASIALEKAAQMGSGKTVLVTAAAGGTGQFALAKLAGNKVIATCGGSDKAMLLKKLGVDRVINYKEENIKTVLKKEFPKGIDIIYESVGGEMFDMCLNALAIYGRLVVIGMISQVNMDPRRFVGLQSVADAVEYLHSGKSIGKVVVCIDPTLNKAISKM
uniref:Enoyl reductase (ER) domain-containing protein n=1 Tax=Chenopodium quinoa TaxID=63459 RepID=A0A803LNU0_CHEQI